MFGNSSEFELVADVQRQNGIERGLVVHVIVEASIASAKGHAERGPWCQVRSPFPRKPLEPDRRRGCHPDPGRLALHVVARVRPLLQDDVSPDEKSAPVEVEKKELRRCLERPLPGGPPVVARVGARAVRRAERSEGEPEPPRESRFDSEMSRKSMLEERKRIDLRSDPPSPIRLL